MSETSPTHSTVESFTEYLKQLQRKGETHVHLDNQAKQLLREFYMRAVGIKTPPVQQAAPANQGNQGTPAQAKTEEPPKIQLSQTQDIPKENIPDAIAATGNTPQAQIDSLKAQADVNPALKSLATLRDKLVFSAGNPEADILFIGEAPGYHDEKQQQPFAGPAGKKLDSILAAMGLKRDQLYLTYLVKFRPSTANQTTGGRTPSAEEIAACLPFIQAEIDTVKPKCIVALGKTTASALLNTSESVESLRGNMHTFHHTPTIVTFNPSYLLQNDDMETKRNIWKDMLLLMEQTGLPISEKQRGYFKAK